MSKDEEIQRIGSADAEKVKGNARLFWLPCLMYAFRIAPSITNIFEDLVLNLAATGMRDAAEIAEFTCLHVEFVKRLQTTLVDKQLLNGNNYSISRKGEGAIHLRQDATAGKNLCVLQEMLTGSLLPALFRDVKFENYNKEAYQCISFPEADTALWNRGIDASQLLQLRNFLHYRKGKRWTEFLNCSIADIDLPRDGRNQKPVYLQCCLSVPDENAASTLVSAFTDKGERIAITHHGLVRLISRQEWVSGIFDTKMLGMPAHTVDQRHSRHNGLQGYWKDACRKLRALTAGSGRGDANRERAYAMAQEEFYILLYKFLSSALYEIVQQHHAEGMCARLRQLESPEAVCSVLSLRAGETYGLHLTEAVLEHFLSPPVSGFRHLGPDERARECMACLLFDDENAEVASGMHALSSNKPDLLEDFARLQEMRNRIAHKPGDIDRCTPDEAAAALKNIEFMVSVFLPGAIAAEDGAREAAADLSDRTSLEARKWLQENFPAWLDVNPMRVASSIFQLALIVVSRSRAEGYRIASKLDSLLLEVIRGYGLHCNLREEKPACIARLCRLSGLSEDAVPGALSGARPNSSPKVLAGKTLALFGKASESDIRQLLALQPSFLEDMAGIIEKRGHANELEGGDLNDFAKSVIKTMTNVLKVFPIE